MRTSCAAALTLSLTVLSANHAGAQEPSDADRQQCVQSYERAQELRLDKKLVEAREALLACMAPSCSDVAKSHCGEWLIEVERAIPTVVLELVDASGKPRTDVTVSVDGKPLASALDGRAMPVDPGEHTFSFGITGGPTVEQRATVAEGARNMRIAVSLAPEEKTAPTPPAPGASDTMEAESSGPHPLPLVLGGVTLLGFGMFAGFGISALVLGGKCKPACSDEQVDDVKIRALVADISLAVGVLALGGTIWAAIATADGEQERAWAGHVRIAAVPMGGGVGVMIGAGY